jgi:hypothetical protein
MEEEIKKSYTVVHSWMARDLGLKGNELLTFAIIFNFSMDGAGKFFGGKKYISKFINSSERCAEYILKGLTEKKLIKKSQIMYHGRLSNIFVVPNEVLSQRKKCVGDLRKNCVEQTKKNQKKDENFAHYNKENNKINNKSVYQNAETIRLGGFGNVVLSPEWMERLSLLTPDVMDYVQIVDSFIEENDFRTIGDQWGPDEFGNYILSLMEENGVTSD